jgi:hypothetical protein
MRPRLKGPGERPESYPATSFTSMLESKIQSNIKKAMKKEFGGMWMNIHGSMYQKKGWPDLQGVVLGIFICIEVKQPGKKNTVSDDQKKCIRKINKNGGFAFVSTTVTHSRIMVRKIIKAHGFKIVKKQAVCLSEKGFKSWTAPGLRRIFYAPGDWKNDCGISPINDTLEKGSS